MLISVLVLSMVAAPFVVAPVEYFLTHQPEIKRARKHKKTMNQMRQANEILRQSQQKKKSRYRAEHDDWQSSFNRILHPEQVTGAVIRTGTGLEMDHKGVFATGTATKVTVRPEPWSQTPPDRLAAALRWHREMEAGIEPVEASLTYLGWSGDILKTKTLQDLVDATETQLRKDGGFD